MNSLNPKLSLVMAFSATLFQFATLSSPGQVLNTTAQVDGSTIGGLATDGVTTIAAESSNSHGTNYALASAGSTWSSTSFVPYDSSSPSYLTDGNLGMDDNGRGPGNSVSTASSPWTFTLNLDTSVNTIGYTLSNIVVISGWDSAFVNQNFTLSFSKDGTNFDTVGSFTLDYSNQTTMLMTLQSSLTQTGGGPLLAADATALTGVKALQFTFNLEPGSNGSTLAAYREIEAFGAPTEVVPEPSTYALLALGGLALLGVSRRQRSA